MKIAIVGSGYVGLVASACFAELGHDVICVDNDPEKLAALVRGETPIHEQYLPELLGRHRGQRLKFSASLPDAVRASSVVFVAVGTPTRETGDADLSYVEAVARGNRAIVERIQGNRREEHGSRVYKRVDPSRYAVDRSQASGFRRGFQSRVLARGYGRFRLSVSGSNRDWRGFRAGCGDLAGDLRTADEGNLLCSVGGSSP